jgi:hypothetical protein
MRRIAKPKKTAKGPVVSGVPIPGDPAETCAVPILVSLLKKLSNKENFLFAAKSRREPAFSFSRITS